MPILGMESVLKQQLVVEIELALKEAGVANPPDAQSIQGLAGGIAAALIPFLIANLQVAPGIVVVTSTGAGATTLPGVVT